MLRNLTQETCLREKDRGEVIIEMTYLESRFLKVHDGIGDLDADWLNRHLNIERPRKSLRKAHQRI